MNYILSCALPYANGNLHVGHFFEATAADIKSRYYKHINKPHIFVSGDDCHGAATTLYCHKNNLDIPTHLEKQYLLHKSSYDALKIGFTNFSKTNTKLHHKVVNWCIENILDYGESIFQTKDVLSWFDSSSEQFLPDRYVKGTCPYCGALEQHPEICEACNKAIVPHELIAPVSVLTQKSVELKLTKHLTLNTKGFYDEVKANASLLHPSIKNKILDASVEPPKYIDISRDSPYYGIDVSAKYFPDIKNQFFYVWFDAPIGYLTFSFEYWLNGQEASKSHLNEFLKNLELEHFIGKDIAYFHTFLWFNLLKTSTHGTAQVKKINFHGWLTLNNEKFSKSKGHQFDLSKLSSAQIDALRFYFFSKHDGSIKDTEFSENEIYEFYNRVVVNGLANFYARSIKILEKNDLTITLKNTQLQGKYTELLESGNYKKLYELVQYDLSQLNSDFQARILWKEIDKEKIKSDTQIFLDTWYEIYHVLALVCPSLKEVEIKGQFLHLANRLEKFSLF